MKSSLAILCCSLFLMFSVQAHDGDHHDNITSPKQKTCPVMGGKINPKLFADVKGKRIYVCCPGCVNAVKKNPDKYIKKLQEKGETIASAPAKQKTCPVMGGKINPKLFADVKGKRIYVCCPGCVNAVKKNPDKYIKKLQEKGEAIESLPEDEHHHD